MDRKVVAVTKDQPAALRLAAWLEKFRSFPNDLEAAAEMRRLHAENEALKSEVIELDPAPGEVVVNGKPELPIDFAEPEPEPVDRRWFVAVLVVMALLWGAIYWRVML